MKIAVIGAGVVGATTALELAERGFRVVLVERASVAGSGTSHANGSSLTPCHAEPWNPPGTWRRLLPALVSRRQPWRLRAGALPGLTGWGVRFLAESRPARYFENTRHCVRLGLYSSACLRRLRDRHALEYDQVTRGSLELYFDVASLEQAIELRHRIDLPEAQMRILDPSALLEREPALAPVAERIHGSLLFPVHESGDACRFSQQAAARAAALGATLRFNSAVRHIRVDDDGVCMQTDDDIIHADACVIAAGCASPGLLHRLGLRLPIQPVKGYSATVAVAPDDPAPELPLLDLKRRFVTARLGPRRLRIAGLAEFAGHDHGLDRSRVRMLLENAAELLPALASRILVDDHQPWTGLRPMTPDGPPLLGPTRIPGIHLNTGHGAMGWTHAAGSARLVADLLEGKSPEIDTSGLLARRERGIG